MSVREYIGARYVPVFADPIQWDGTISYEPLTVVTDNGTSYVSRQSVPPGTAIDNEQYWVRWADYNAQLEEYIRQVQTYSASITALNEALPIADFDDDNTVKDAIDGLSALLPGSAFDSVNTVKDAIDGLSALLPGSAFDSVNTVDARFDTVEANGWVTTDRIANKAVTYDKIADSLRKKLITDDSIRNECVLMLGDSYAQGVGADGTNWQSLLINLLGLQDTYIYKAGSAGFLTVSTSTNGSSSPVPINTTYGEVLEYAYQYINGLGRADEVKHIIIQCGWNDSNATGLTKSALETAIVNCMNNLHSWFPNAKIYIAATYCGSTQKTSTWTKSTVTEACRCACNRKGAAFSECVNLPWLFQNASNDTVHPTATMQNYLAGFIGRLLIAGYADDYEGWSADEYAWISKDHYFMYQTTPTVTVGADNEIIAANWSRTAESRANFDFPAAIVNVTDSNAMGLCVVRMYNTGRMRIPYAIQSSGSMNQGDKITVALKTSYRFH